MNASKCAWQIDPQAPGRTAARGSERIFNLIKLLQSPNANSEVRLALDSKTNFPSGSMKQTDAKALLQNCQLLSDC
jgi:hypothetical protein